MTISVALLDDDEEDGGETFTLRLHQVSGAHLADAEAVGTILNTELPVEEEPGATPSLTASFEGVPAEHDGASVFTFRLRFSEPPAVSFRILRDHSFQVEGGTVTRARRVDGRDDLREIHVAPSSYGDVTVTLAGGRACDAAGGICTADGTAAGEHARRDHSGPGGDHGSGCVGTEKCRRHYRIRGNARPRNGRYGNTGLRDRGRHGDGRRRLHRNLRKAHLHTRRDGVDGRGGRCSTTRMTRAKRLLRCI